GRPRSIESFFPAGTHEPNLRTLEELVLIEIEFAWKRWWSDQTLKASTVPMPPPVENYLQRFTLLRRSDCRRRLSEHESELRRRPGPVPTSVKSSSNSDIASSRFRAGAEVDRLRLVEPVASGSFGVVWKAFDPHLGREVAVKQLIERHQAE